MDGENRTFSIVEDRYAENVMSFWVIFVTNKIEGIKHHPLKRRI